MEEFSKQGTLATAGTGTVIATGTPVLGVFLSKVTTMRFHNLLAYTIDVYKYEALTSTTTLIYELNLSAGDTVTDTLTYALNEGDEIRVLSNISNTTYYANGILY
jgi:hypothetical protein